MFRWFLVISSRHKCSDYGRLLKVSAMHFILFLSMFAVYDLATMNTADAVSWTSPSAKLEHYVGESDRIVTGMVTDKETIGDTEYVWISVYQWLKNEVTNAGQIILDLDRSQSARRLELDIGEEVLLTLVDVDVVNGHFGLYYPYFDFPSTFPISLKDEVLSIVEKLSENKTREQEEEEELQRLLNQSGSENCSIMQIEWTNGGRNDEFFYCTYENEDERFYVPISVTLSHVKDELLKHVSDQYFDEHFNLRRAWDEAIVNGKAEPSGQMMEFEYILGNFTFIYSAHVSLGFEEDDRNLLYLSYSPPREITNSPIRDMNQIDEIIYNSSSSCLKPGTPYIPYDAAAVSRVDGGFSPVIGGRGPPDVFDRNGNQVREAEKRFQIWFDTGEILCTSNVKQEDEIDKTIGRQNQIVLMDASEYVKASESMPLPFVTADSGEQQFPMIIGIGAGIAGVIAFIVLRKRK